MMLRARTACFLALLLTLVSAAAAQQFMFYPYYGKNKVLYETFRWKTYPTEHFNLHFYSDQPQTLKTIAVPDRERLQETE